MCSLQRIKTVKGTAKVIITSLASAFVPVSEYAT